MENKAKTLRESFERVAHKVRPLELIVQGGALSEQDMALLNRGLAEMDRQTSGIEKTLTDLMQRYQSNEESAKFKIWERKLLDLSMRNSLLNMHIGKNSVVLSDENSALVEDKLYSGGELALEGRAVAQLYRIAKNYIEETGANSLFLSLGALQWCDKSGKEHKAPILLMPVELIKLKGKDNYVLRKRDEDTVLNITLLELLKVEFDITIAGINPLPTDEQGIDVNLVFHRFSQAVADHDGWGVCEEAVLGVFSFTKFVMWNDIHTNMATVVANPIIKSLIEGKLVMNNDVEPVDMRAEDISTEPISYIIPLDADSSQMAAVIEAERGRTFVLNGPPGTGKSQSITNIISNALYHGRKVLFVAQKKVALDVVKKRLDKLGLAPFCLELHSNKLDKRYFLQQLQEAIDITYDDDATEYAKVAEALRNERITIRASIDALHRKQSSGNSLYDCIEKYLALGASAVAMPENLFKSSPTITLEAMLDDVVALDTSVKLLNMLPSQHPLFGLYPKSKQSSPISYGRREGLEEVLPAMPSAVAEVKQQMERNLKMGYGVKTTRQYIDSNYKLKKLFQYASVDEALLDDIDAFAAAIDRWVANIDQLPKWRDHANAVAQLESRGLGEVYRRYSGGESIESLCDAVKAGYCKALSERIIETDVSLAAYSGIALNAVIDKYKQLHADFKRVSQDELVCRMKCRAVEKVSDKEMSTEVTLLRKRIASKGRGTSIRTMIDQMPNLLGSVAPVMLMSPLSVAQYLNVDNHKFDLVIFDEASQMPTCDAVGSIARANAAIIVGDSQQMPPTNFFSMSVTDESDADVDDMDSILDDCLALSVPKRTLNWHYRSNHEDLIAFSNHHYYDGELVTFPSANDCRSHVTLEHVEGYYDMGKTRTNAFEAEAVVNDVIQRLRTNPQQSLGIVTFSIQQSNLIYDMLGDALASNPELEQLNAQAEEPIFVKNLENVQGDERDVILFSIGYGPDKDGKVSMNFGPLNKMGGEKRLNVAITRARNEMKIFSTLRSDDIDLRRTQAEGVAGLKAFLRFAEGRSAVSEITSDDTAPSILSTQIAQWLQSLGYQVRCNVGYSNCKVDVAVLHPNDPTRYILGIVSDGTSYNKLSTVQDKEVVRPSMLRRLGWKLFRVSYVDWFKDPSMIKGNIVATLKEVGC